MHGCGFRAVVPKSGWGSVRRAARPCSQVLERRYRELAQRAFDDAGYGSEAGELGFAVADSRHAE